MAIQRVAGRSLLIHQAADIVNPEVGDVWYNTTDKYLKIKIAPSVSNQPVWSVGGSATNLNVAGGGPGWGFGTLLAGVAGGGSENAAPYSTNTDATMEYDGTTWTDTGDLPFTNGNGAGSFGSQTAGLMVGGGGSTQPSSGQSGVGAAEYNGTTWTRVADLSPVGSGIHPSFSAGTQTAGYVAGGHIGTAAPGNIAGHSDDTYEYDGTAWTIGGSLVGGVSGGGGCGSGSTGTQTAGLAVGGWYGEPGFSTPSSTTEEYNGTTWSSGGTLSIVRADPWSTGTQTDCIATGGTGYHATDPATGATTTEEYDGSTWALVSVNWASTDTSKKGHWLKNQGGGYPGSGNFAGTGFVLMYTNVGTVLPGYCEEFTRTGVLQNIDRIKNVFVRDLCGWSFQGQFNGYHIGGNGNGPIYDRIERSSYSSDTNSVDVGDLTTDRVGITPSLKSMTHGYCAGGGDNAGARTNTIEKFQFASSANAVDVSDMTASTHYAAGASSADNCYMAGGGIGASTNSNKIEKLVKSTEVNSTDIGDLTRITTEVCGATDTSGGFGYMASGVAAGTPAGSNVIDRFSFASGTQNATDVGDMNSPSYGGSGASSLTHGYTMGGYSNAYLDKIEKYAFASSANATDIGNLSTAAANETHSGNSSTTHGYAAGGIQTGTPLATYISRIDKFPFATDTNATAIADLTIVKSNLAGTQN